MGSFNENMVGGSDSAPEIFQPSERTVCVFWFFLDYGGKID